MKIAHVRRGLTVWFSAGVVLTTATQLRISGMPVGPGELLLAAWLLVSGSYLLWTRRIARPTVARALLLFWCVAIPTALAGTLTGIALGVGPAGGFYHDLPAFLFVALLFGVFTFQPGVEKRVQETAMFVSSFTVVPLLVLLVYGHRLAIVTWYGTRFTGWARNPNQLALAVAMIPFYGLTMAARSRRLAHRVAYLLLALGSVIIGVASQSDALTAAWSFGLAAGGVWAWYQATRKPSRSYIRVAVLRIGLPLLALLLVLLTGQTVAAALSEKIAGIYNYGGQGSVRATLAYMGVRAIAASPVFGLGPGAFSGYSAPFQGSEAHNTLVDWGASTGLIGVALYLGLFGWLVARAWSRGHGLMAVAILTLLVFSSLHYVIRHPTFWFYLVLIATLSSDGHEDAPIAGP